MATGLDPSRAAILAFTPYYWGVSTHKLRDWLADWDAWEADKPKWFTNKDLDFQNIVMKEAPVEALRRAPLLKILDKAKDSEGNPLRVAPEADTDRLVAEVQKHRKDASARERTRRFAKALLAARLYIVAIVISYVDLAGDVAVGLEFMQSKSNAGAGYTTLGLTAGSMVIQAFLSLAMGQGPVAACCALVGAKPLLE